METLAVRLKTGITKVSAFFLTVLLGGPHLVVLPQNDQRPPLAFVHVTVIDATGARPKTDMTVVINGNRITALGKTGRIAVEANAIVQKYCTRARVIIHSPTDQKLRAFCVGDTQVPARGYLSRNHQTVRQCDMLVQCRRPRRGATERDLPLSLLYADTCTFSGRRRQCCTSRYPR